MAKIVIQESDDAVLDVLSIALKMEGFEVVPVMDADQDVLRVLKLGCED